MQHDSEVETIIVYVHLKICRPTSHRYVKQWAILLAIVENIHFILGRMIG